MNSIVDVSVREVIYKIIDDAMEQKDRYVTINFFEHGPSVTIYPFCDTDDGKEYEER